MDKEFHQILQKYEFGMKELVSKLEILNKSANLKCDVRILRLQKSLILSRG